MEQSYPALRTIGNIYKLLGSIVGAITALAVIGLCASGLASGRDTVFGPFGGILGGLIGSLLVTLYGGGIALTLYAAGEGMFLLIALEENTRATALALQRQASAPAAGPVLSDIPLGGGGQVQPRE